MADLGAKFRANEGDLGKICDEILARSGAKSHCIFLLNGEIGAGKTALVKAFVAHLGYKDCVTSPTFSLLHIYDLGESKDLSKAQNASLQGEAEAIQQDDSAFGKVLSSRNRGYAVANDEIRLGVYRGNEQQNSAIYADKTKPKTHPLTPSAREGESLECAGRCPNPHLLLQSKSKQKDLCDSTLESRPLRGAKIQNQGSSSASAGFLLEAEKRGSPPKSEKAAAFWRVGGAGRGVQPFLREKTGESSKNLDEKSAIDSRESKSFLPTFSKSKWAWAKPIKNNISPSLAEGVRGWVKSQNPKDSRESNESQEIFRLPPQNDKMLDSRESQEFKDISHALNMTNKQKSQKPLDSHDSAFAKSCNDKKDSPQIYHYDLYQKGLDYALDLGILDELEKDGIHFVEWGDLELFKILKSAFENIYIIHIHKTKNARIYEFKENF